MRSGRKHEPIHLLAPTEITNDVGDKLITYALMPNGECFGAVEPGGRIGGRKYKDDQGTTHDRVLIVFDYNAAFHANCRILHVETGVHYRVMRLQNPQMRNIELRAECESIEDI